jgi:hypothetical protein
MQLAASITSLKSSVKMAESDSVASRKGGKIQISTVFIHWNTFHYSCWWNRPYFACMLWIWGPWQTDLKTQIILRFLLVLPLKQLAGKPWTVRNVTKSYCEAYEVQMYRTWTCGSRQHNNEIRQILRVSLRLAQLSVVETVLLVIGPLHVWVSSIIFRWFENKKVVYIFIEFQTEIFL